MNIVNTLLRLQTVFHHNQTCLAATIETVGYATHMDKEFGSDVRVAYCASSSHLIAEITIVQYKWLIIEAFQCFKSQQ